MSERISTVILNATVGKKQVLLMAHTEPDSINVSGFSVVIREDGEDTTKFHDKSVRKAKARFDKLSADKGKSFGIDLS